MIIMIIIHAHGDFERVFTSAFSVDHRVLTKF